MSEANRRALSEAIAVARGAGALLRRAFHQPPRAGEVDGKSVADREAEDLIRTRLTAAFPEHGFRAEERPEANRGAKAPDGPVWLVDPNDGTSAFQRGHRGASVSIALIQHGRPILGVIYAYAAPDDGGDLFAWAEGCGPLTRNGAPVIDPGWPEALSADDTVFVSNSADVRAVANGRSVWPARYQPVPGIAYRLALAAVGDGAAATSLFHPRDFDFAAGHALLRGVGGVLLDERGRPVTYDPDRPHRVGFCFGGGPAVCKALAQLDWQAVLRAPRIDPGAYDLVRPEPGALTTDAGRLSRAQGCWLGQLVGDALGTQVEGQAPAAIEAAWPQGVNALVDGGAHDLIAGQVSDSEMARALAHSLIEAGGYDPAAAERAYRWWFETMPPAVPEAARARLADESDGSRAAGPAGGGAVVRTAPLAIAGHGWPERRLLEALRGDARSTGASPVEADASAAVGLAIAFALREGPSAEGVFSHALAGAKALGLDPAVIAAVESAGDGPGPAHIQSGARVLPALRNGFSQLLFADDLANGLMDTVSRGGDPSLSGAVAGALLGAVHGREAIPWIWRDRVLTCRPIKGLPGVRRPRPRALWPVDAMVLAERLLTSS